MSKDKSPTPVGAFGATFSPCRTWRYLLWRTWGDAERRLMFVGLNPSTADETADDPTVRRCIGYAKAWGFGGLMMTNLFGFRSTDPKGLLDLDDPVGPGNDAAILAQAAVCPAVVLAWGNHGRLNDRDAQLLAALAGITGLKLQCLGVNANGTPKHPLYLPAAARRREFSPG